MRAGPKPAVTAGPLDLSRLPRRGGSRAIRFVETFLRVPKGKGARTRLKLRPWQKAIVHALLDEPRPRQGLLSIPRGNGKTTLCSALGLYGLFADGIEGAQVVSVASDERQARILFNIARRMVELDPRLEDRCQVFQDRLYVPQTDSSLFALPAEPGALQGFDPSLAIVDELGFVTDDVWEGVSLAAGKRPASLTLAISTPAGDSDSVMWRLVEHGRAGDDPSFYYAEFAAPAGCDVDDEDAWATANPALGDFLAIDALRATRRTSREVAFKRFRLGMWIEGFADAWMPLDAWDACSTGEAVDDGAEVVIALDGSFNADATALVVATIGGEPHVDVVALWERGPGDRDGWRVPVADVEATIRDACRRWQVAEIVADPFRWTRTLQVLEDEGLPVVEFPQSAARMTPATTGLYEAVANGTVTHSGDPDLRRHVSTAVLKVDSRGPRIRKEHKSSTRRIDLAVAAVMAHSRATALAGEVVPLVAWGS